jgi:PAS domain S-box-containing protein
MKFDKKNNAATNQPTSEINVQHSDFARFDALVEWQGDILQLIAEGAPLKTILTEITLWVERTSISRPLASILLMDKDGKHLLHGAAPSLPDPYNQVINGIEIGPAVGSCGTAAFTRQMVVVEDIATDPLWKNFKSLALLYDLKACWSTPLISKNGTVLGTFAFYYTEPKKPTEEDLRIIKMLNKTAVIAIEARRAEEQRTKSLLKEKAAQVRVKEERQHFYRLLINAPAIIAVLRGPDHVFELANPMYMQAVGIARDILGKPITEALPEVASQGIVELLDNVYSTGEPYEGLELLLKLEKSPGKLVDSYFNFIYQPIYSDSNDVEGIFVHAVDVTEMVLARKKVEASEERFRSFVLNAPTPIGIYVGREMRIQTVNNAILEAWDRTYDDVKGKTFREVLHELEGQGFYELLEQVYDTGVAYEAKEARVDLIRDGKLQTTYYNFTYSPLKNEKGEIYGVMNTAAEVTDLVLAKQKLQETQESLHEAIELTELGTWESDFETHEVTMSSKIEEWFGLKTGCSAADIRSRIHPDDIGKLDEAVASGVKGNGRYIAEFRVTPPGGNERILKAQGKVVRNENNELVKLTGTTLDITTQKLAEKQLEELVQQRTAALKEMNTQLKNANADLERMNKDLEHFAYVTSHDLQEPLRKLKLFSDILLQTYNESLPETARKYVTKIFNSVTRMHSLVRDLLAYSGLNKPEIQFVKSDLNAIIDNVKDDFELYLAEKDVAFHVAPLPVLEVNAAQVQQLFFNLVSNALKFTKSGVQPAISITSHRLDRKRVQEFATLNHDREHVEIIVKDNGIGFDPQYAEQIFVIFQRLHNREVFDGTGIGLALCKRIVTNHNGEIFAVGTPGEGASFHIILPENHQ